MNLYNLLKKVGFLIIALTFVSSMAFAQTTYYVNNSAVGNDGRNGLSATIPVPDDGITGPKKTIDGAQGALSATVANDIIVVASTGITYNAATGEPGTIAVDMKITFQSTGGTPNIGSIFNITTGDLDNTVTFNSGAFTLSGGLTLTAGELVNSSQLITVSASTVLVAAIVTTTKVTGQLLYSGAVNFNYTAAYTTADEFPSSGSFNNFNSGAVAVVLKTSSASMTGDFTTGGTLDLGGNTLDITNTAAATHAFGANVTNGTLGFNMGGDDVTVNGAFAIPGVTATTSTSTARTLILADPTSLTGTLIVSGNASVTTSAALVTVGTNAFTGDEVVNGGEGTITLTGSPTTVHGNVLLNKTGITETTNPHAITFNGAGAVTVNGNVTNATGFIIADDAVFADATTGRIAFPDQDITITGNVVNSVTLGGVVGTSTDVGGNNGIGQILFVNVATDVTINGAMINSSSTSLSGATVPLDFSLSGLITFVNTPTTAIIRIDGGITNSSDFSGLTDAANTNNGQIILGGAARTGISTIGTGGDRVGAIVNSSKGKNGNGAITIGVGDATSGGFFGTSVEVSGTVEGGNTTFGGENFDVSGTVTNSRTFASTSLLVGVAVVATRTVTIGGGLVNSGTATTNVNIVSTGAVAITGTIQSTADGTIAFPLITDGTFSAGGFTWSAGTFTVPATHTVNIALGAANVSGGTVTWLGAAGGDLVIISGTASFTGGTVNTGLRGSITLNSSNITLGDGTGNTTFASATADIIIGNPSPTSLVTVNVGSLNPTIAGALEVNNTTGLTEAVRFTGGTLNIDGTLTFTAGKVGIIGSTNLRSNGVFLNTAGYTTTDQARVVVNAATFGGAGDFGTVEFLRAAGMATTSTVKLTGTIYLTDGAVDNGGGDITINNSTTTPTIVRNSGTFAQAPTFSSNVNVTYIGGDKAVGNELPGGATRLQNLTVATTTGTEPGKGIVDINSATVNGTLNVFVNQTLLILNNQTLTVAGASVVLNGNIVNQGNGKIAFGATNGTTVTGAGYLPNVTINAASSGNVIVGKAIINEFLGNDGDHLADDFDPLTTAAQGALTFITGTNSASFNLVGVTDGSMVGAVTTAGTGNTLTLAANLVSTGNLVHAAGTIALGAFNYEVRGPSAPGATTITLGKTGTASFSGTGTLKFFQADNTSNGAFTLNSDGTGTGSTIDVPVELDNKDVTGAEDDLILGTGPLTMTNTFTITDGELVLGQNLTLTGSALTIETAGSSSGAGILRLNAATPPLTFTYSGTPTIEELRISNDVDLAGTGTALTISTLLTHDGGQLNFGSQILTVSGNFTRTAGTYAASPGATLNTGYLVWTTGGTFAQGAGFSIPNLAMTTNLASADNAWVVQDNLRIADGVTLTHQTVATPRLSVGVSSGSIPTIHITGSGDLDVSPAFPQGQVNYNFEGNVATTIASTTKFWPSSVTVNTVTLNSTAAAPNLLIDDDRTISGTSTLNLVDGELQIELTRTLTLASGLTINIDAANASLDVDPNDGGAGTGTLVAPSVNIVYQTTAGTTGDEYTFPTVVNNVTIDIATTINGARTIAGILDVNQNLTIASNTTVNGAIDVASGKTLTVNAVLTTSSNVTINGTIAGTGSFTFSGATGQTLTLPAAGAAIQTITLNMTGTNPALNVLGGNINMTTAGADIINFTNGILNMGTNTLIMNRPNVASNSGLGFNRAGVTGTNVGHVVGKIQRAAVTGDGQTGTNGRFEFPTGTLSGQYRPASVTFTPAYVVGNPTSIVVSHVDANPEGTQGLPTAGGEVGRYTDFYWLVSTTPSSFTGTQRFDLDLQANNIGIPFSSQSVLRIIRRQDGNAATNPWSIQGTAANYDNFIVVVGSDTTVTVRTTSSQGGLVTAGSRFTIGTPGQGPSFTTPTTLTYTVLENDTTTIPVKAVPNTVGTTITSVSLSDAPSFVTYVSAGADSGTVTIAPSSTDGRTGVYTADLKATDSNGDSTTITLTITVADVNALPVITAHLDTGNVKIGNTVNFTYTATDADAGDTLSFFIKSTVGGPANVAAITSAGVFSWQSAAADSGKTITFVVAVTDGKDTVDAHAAAITVVNNSAPTWATNGELTDTTIVVGDTLNFTYNAEDLDNDPITYAFVGAHPNEATINDSTGVFSWIPATFLQFPVVITISATDGIDTIQTQAQVTVTPVVGIEDVNAIPENYELSQNYPNPFNPATTINYALKVTSQVSIIIYNNIGQQVLTLVDGSFPAGFRSVQFNASRIASGIYFYRIIAKGIDGSDFIQTKKMILLK